MLITLSRGRAFEMLSQPNRRLGHGQSPKPSQVLTFDLRVALYILGARNLRPNAYFQAERSMKI
ncbi:MAG UNVERIFIED_CONTAM: hypothetical protein LVR29_08980 [Microcystis novacekii LVE1205-3]